MGKRAGGCNPFRDRSRKCKIITGSIIFIIVVVVASLIGWGVHKNKTQSSPSVSVIVPLYLYPSEGAWDPLYNGVTKYPNMEFVVIINPASGPGNGSINPDFAREITRLNEQKNVKCIGYVRTTWATRNISQVYADVSQYASWGGNSSDYQIDGIFFDEAPNNYTVESVEYMSNIDAYVRNDKGLGNSSFIVHNPGSVPDDRCLVGANVYVVFESAYDVYSTPDYSNGLKHLNASSINGNTRQNYSYMVNAVPSNWTTSNMTQFVGSIKDSAQYIYITDNSLANEDIYASFGDDWNTFIQVMAQDAS